MGKSSTSGPKAPAIAGAPPGPTLGTKPVPVPKPPPGRDLVPSPGPVDIVPPGAGPQPPPTIDQAVAAINGLFRKGALLTAIAIANYLLANFLGGDEEALDSAPRHPSLRAIARHPGLGFSASSLWVALAVRRQWPLLPPDVAGELTLSQHRLLLGVTERRAKVALARRAVRDRLTSRELAAEVARWRAAHAHPAVGHPPTDPVVAAVRRAVGALRHAWDEAAHEPRPGLSRGELPDLLDETEEQVAKLRERLGLAG